MKRFFKVVFSVAAIAMVSNAATIGLYNGDNQGTGTAASRIWSDVLPGVDMTVTAFSLFGTWNPSLTTQFGSNTIGLGVCNSGELAGGTCNFDDWQVDNSGAVDGILFTFSSPVNVGNVVIRQTSGTHDSDAEWGVNNGFARGNSSSGGTLTPFFQAFNPLNLGTENVNWRSIDIGQSNVTTLFLSTALNPANDRDDYFKAFSIEVTAVPEPGSMALLGCGLLGLGLLGRRRTAKK